MLSCSVLCKELESKGIKTTKMNLNLDPDKKDRIFGLLIETGGVNKQIAIPVDPVLCGAQSIAEAAELVMDVIDASKLPETVDYAYYLKKDYILNHVKLALMEKIWQPFLFKDSIFKDIMEYCYIEGVEEDQRWLLEIREDLIQDLNITVDELWEAAKTNTFARKFDFVLRSVSDIMGKKAQKLMENSPIKYIYSISNRSGLQGAVQILNPSIFSLLTRDTIAGSLIIYPQSENNFLLGPNVPGVLESMINIAENDTNYRYLSTYLYEVARDFEVKREIPFNPIG